MLKITKNKPVIAALLIQCNVYKDMAKKCADSAWEIIYKEFPNASKGRNNVDLLTWEITEIQPERPESTLSVAPTAGKAD
jgi:hypothetical protein